MFVPQFLEQCDPRAHPSVSVALQDIAEAFRAGDLEKALDFAIKLRYTTRIGEAILQKL